MRPVDEVDFVCEICQKWVAFPTPPLVVEGEAINACIDCQASCITGGGVKWHTHD